MKRFKVYLCRENDRVLATWIIEADNGNAACCIVREEKMSPEEILIYQVDRKVYLANELLH